MSKTNEDLKIAFAGEAQANRSYSAYAAKADEDGNPKIAHLFRVVAAGEAVHASNHFRVMGGIGSIEENLKVAIDGENYEITKMYVEFMADAKKENADKAYKSFLRAWQVEQEHEVLFKEALETMGESIGDDDIWVCPVCGHAHFGIPPEKCPICQTPGERFFKVD